ncbi:MAG: glycerol-3-phosphate 1-O-acyltransferase PlsY [Oscillospiraceae bacterium]|jgi:glycerol-3-phosphate acyltransferase PlsY|nr:glycerol-3-phosphate 1-O-acyltransferase PlsY [Oscillospiraceae bacterium]
MFLSNHLIYFLLLFAIAYLLGSANFSIIISFWIYEKKDIRNLGSKNAGFTNVLRSIGILPAILTFIGDFLKSILAIYISKLTLNFIKCPNEKICFFLYVIGFFCFLGHIYPLYFNFKGGKGILTSWAINLLINWKVFLVLFLIYLVLLAIFRIMSVASLVTAICFPIMVFIFTKSLASSSVALIMVIIIFFKHKSNIKRLIKKKEKRISIKKKITVAMLFEKNL